MDMHHVLEHILTHILCAISDRVVAAGWLVG